MKFKAATLTMFFLMVQGLCLAQYTILPKPIGEESLVYETEKVFHARAHSNGFSLGYSKGEIVTWYKTKHFYLDIGSLKHQKEFSQNFRFDPGSRSFIYGKINRLYALRGGVGTKRYFSEKARRKSIVVGINYEYGFTLGFLKPYYLKIKRDIGGQVKGIPEPYSEANADLWLDETEILGGAEFRYGWFESKIKPGFHGKIGAIFSYGNEDQYIKAIEAGIMTDVFLGNVPLMLTEENKPYFLNVYLTLQFGRRS